MSFIAPWIGFITPPGRERRPFSVWVDDKGRLCVRLFIAADFVVTSIGDPARQTVERQVLGDEPRRELLVRFQVAPWPDPTQPILRLSPLALPHLYAATDRQVPPSIFEGIVGSGEPRMLFWSTTLGPCGLSDMLGVSAPLLEIASNHGDLSAPPPRIEIVP